MEYNNLEPSCKELNFSEFSNDMLRRKLGSVPHASPLHLNYSKLADSLEERSKLLR